MPLVLHLLAPNGRAQQVTSDLAGFWSRHYPAIRKELMRRYPRHSWPEDGATAIDRIFGDRKEVPDPDVEAEPTREDEAHGDEGTETDSAG